MRIGSTRWNLDELDEYEMNFLFYSNKVYNQIAFESEQQKHASEWNNRTTINMWTWARRKVWAYSKSKTE